MLIGNRFNYKKRILNFCYKNYKETYDVHNDSSKITPMENILNTFYSKISNPAFKYKFDTCKIAIESVKIAKYVSL